MKHPKTLFWDLRSNTYTCAKHRNIAPKGHAFVTISGENARPNLYFGDYWRASTSRGYANIL